MVESGDIIALEERFTEPVQDHDLPSLDPTDTFPLKLLMMLKAIPLFPHLASNQN